MVENKNLNALLIQLTLGASLAFVMPAISAAAIEPTLLTQAVEAEDEGSKFYDRVTLADTLFGETDASAALKAEIADIDADIKAKDAEITVKTEEIDAAKTAGSDTATLESELTTLQGQLTDLQTDLGTKTTEFEGLNADHILPLADLTDEQVFAMNRSFNGWVNNAFDVTLSEELIALLLSGELTDEQVRFAIKAEFEGEKFNQLADRLEGKGHTAQAQRMRDRGETQKERFNTRAGIDTDATGATSDIITDQAKGAARAAAHAAAREEAKGQTKAEAKRAAKEDARQNSKDNAKSMGKGNN